MNTFPTRDEFLELAKRHKVVCLSVELLADGLTPVAVASHFLGRGTFLFESVTGGEKWGRYSFVGFDARFEARAIDGRYVRRERGGDWEEVACDDPWDQLRAELAAREAAPVADLPFAGGGVGYVPYEAVHRFEPRVGAIEGVEFHFKFGSTVVAFDNVRHTVRVIVPVEVQDNPAATFDIALGELRTTCRELASTPPLGPLPMPKLQLGELPRSNFSKDDFCAAVKRCKEHIVEGDIFQVVLSQKFTRPFSADAFLVYRLLRVLNPSPYMYFMDMGERTIVGASPETLVRLNHGIAEVRPIAGTRPRGSNVEEDQRLASELLSDPKERAEHVMLVDLGRNDVGRIAKPGTVKICDRMVIERYSHVMHIVSGVQAQVRDGLDAIDVFRATFPAGTLSGAPKVRAMEIISALEPSPRDVYGGAVGYFGYDGSMDVAIAIRTVVFEGGQATVQAGAGLVADSDPESEYQETINKASAVLAALEYAESDEALLSESLRP